MKRTRKSRSNHGIQSIFSMDWRLINQTFSRLEKKAGKYYTQVLHLLPVALKGKTVLAKGVKKNLEKFVKTLQKSDVAHIAKSFAKSNGKKVLNLLNFPSKKDVSKLNTRVTQLEKRFQGLRRAA